MLIFGGTANCIPCKFNGVWLAGNAERRGRGIRPRNPAIARASEGNSCVSTPEYKMTLADHEDRGISANWLVHAV